MSAGIADRIGNSAAAVLGAAAFAASALHVYSVCIGVAGDNPGGEDRFVAVLITVSVELLALVSMLELRRGSRWPPFVGLLVGVSLTLAANLATAKQNGPGWGWPETVAVAPAVLFLVVLAIVETRPGQTAEDAESETRTESGTETETVLERESTPPVSIAPTETRTPRVRPTSEPSRPPRLVETGAAKIRMRAHWDTERAAGRTPSGAALDRIGGTKNYGRGLVREWLAEEDAARQPAGAEA